MQVSIRRKYEKQEVSGDYFYMLRIRFLEKQRVSWYNLYIT